MLHRARVRNRVLTIMSGPSIVVDGIQSDALELDLDAEWSSYDTVTVIFSAGLDDADPISAIWAESVEIPWEKLVSSGPLYVSVVGYIDGTQRAITALMDEPFAVIQRGAIDGQSAADPTQDAYQVAYANAMAAATAANTAADDASDAADDASDAAATATTAATTATSAASAATSAAEAANTAASAVVSAADDAEAAADAAWLAAERAGWYIDGHTLVMGASAEVVGEVIKLGGAD